MGRPVEKVPENIAAPLVEWISEGKTLREFCRQDGMPSFGTIYNWINKDPLFAQRIACARESGEEQISQECLDIADNATNDWMERNNKDGESIGWELNGDHVQRDKLRIDTRLKLLAKWNPKKYGDRVALEHSGKVSLENLVCGIEPDPNE